MSTLLPMACAIWVGSEAWIVGRTKGTAGATLRDRGSRFVILGGVTIGVLFAVMVRRVFPSADIIGYRVPLFYAGIVLMAAGIALRIYAVRTLGRFFTTVVITQAGQTVIDDGPYRLVRHPSYSGALLTFFGLCAALTNWFAFIALAPVVLGIAYRIAVEEKALVEALGDAYRQYQRRTKRLIPFLI